MMLLNFYKSIIAFFKILAYTVTKCLGGNYMNKFEKNVQSKNNDVIDAGLAFIVGFVALAVIYIIPQVFAIVAG